MKVLLTIAVVQSLNLAILDGWVSGFSSA